MRTTIRALAAVLLLSMTSACAMVASDKPLFTEADGAGALRLKPGVWSAPTGDCAYDPKSPITGWPDCANGTVVSPDGKTLVNQKREDPTAPKQLTYQMVAGKPQMLQIGVPEGGKPEDPHFLYAFVAPLKQDPDGAMNEIQVGLVLCVQPPKGPDMLTAEPKALPGFTYVKGEMFCRTDNPAKLRAAAKTNFGWLKGDDEDWILHATWLRDGDK
jgi:hypothetical protein